MVRFFCIFFLCACRAVYATELPNGKYTYSEGERTVEISVIKIEGTDFLEIKGENSETNHFYQAHINLANFSGKTVYQGLYANEFYSGYLKMTFWYGGLKGNGSNSVHEDKSAFTYETESHIDMYVLDDIDSTTYYIPYHMRNREENYKGRAGYPMQFRLDPADNTLEITARAVFDLRASLKASDSYPVNNLESSQQVDSRRLSLEVLSKFAKEVIEILGNQFTL